MDITPRHSGEWGLAEKTKIFIIVAPVVALSGKVLYNGHIFHKDRSSLGVLTRINRHKHMEGLRPEFEGRYFLWLD